MIRVTENLRKIRDLLHKSALEHGRDPESVRLVAVSKKQPLSAVLEAAAAGQREFGENLLQEGLEKIQTAGRDDLIWHFIGRLQSNKTKAVAEHFDWAHTIDREKTARRLSEQRPGALPPLCVCIQVNVDDEASKTGVPPEQAVELAEYVSGLDRLRLRGFMCIPAPKADFAAQRKSFRAMRQLLGDARGRALDVDTLSMGMSDDFTAAIAEGATHVRIGTAVFGPRH